MKFVDLKRTKADKKSREESYKNMSPDGDDYPYGLTVRLSSDELKKLGLSTMPKTGTEIELEAKAYVVSVTDNQRDGRHERSIELQLRKIALEGADDEPEEADPEARTRGMMSAIDKALKRKG